MAFLILFAGCWLGGYLFPWWWPALAACAVGAWLPRRSAAAVLSGFLGAGAAWAAAAAWRDVGNHRILSTRIAELFQLPGPVAALAATALLGGIMGALGGWAGYALREWIRPRGLSAGMPAFADARKAAAEAAGSESSGVTASPERSEGRAAGATRPDETGPAPASEGPLAGPDGAPGS